MGAGLNIDDLIAIYASKWSTGPKHHTKTRQNTKTQKMKSQDTEREDLIIQFSINQSYVTYVRVYKIGFRNGYWDKMQERHKAQGIGYTKKKREKNTLRIIKREGVIGNEWMERWRDRK